MDSNDDDTIESIAEGITRAGAVSPAGDGEFGEAQEREAVATAKLHASNMDANEALDAGKELHTRLGPAGSDNEAVDVYRRRYAEASGVDGALLEDEDIGLSKIMESRGVTTDPRGTQFQQERRKHANSEKNKERMYRTQGNDDRAAKHKQRAARIESAESPDELRSARGMLSDSERAALMDNARENAGKSREDFKEDMRRTKRRENGIPEPVGGSQ